MRPHFLLYFISFTLWLGPLLASGPSFAQSVPKSKTQLTVSAAISLKEALQKIVADFEQKNPEIDITLNVAASGQLRAQIERDAPVDLFISAAAKDLEELIARGKVVTDSQTFIARNRLVFATNKTASHRTLKGLEYISRENFQRIAIGQIDSVPAGRYAKQALDAAQKWSDLKKVLIPCENARQVLDYIARNEVDGGFIYASDLFLEDRVRQILVVPSHFHEPIVYPAVLLSSSQAKEPALKFLSYLKSSEAQNVLESFGFLRGNAKL